MLRMHPELHIGAAYPYWGIRQSIYSVRLHNYSKRRFRQMLYTYFFSDNLLLYVNNSNDIVTKGQYRLTKNSI